MATKSLWIRLLWNIVFKVWKESLFLVSIYHPIVIWSMCILPKKQGKWSKMWPTIVEIFWKSYCTFMKHAWMYNMVCESGIGSILANPYYHGNLWKGNYGQGRAKLVAIHSWAPTITTRKTTCNVIIMLLHDVGEIICFKDENFVVVNPNLSYHDIWWVTWLSFRGMLKRLIWRPFF